MEGVVRSRSGRSFTLIDTGGVTLDSHHSVADGPEGLRGFEAEILQQTQAAMDEASVFCLVVDGRDGLMPFDEHLASFVRRAGKPTLLVVNKVDGMEHEDTMLAEFHALGFPMLALSAEHGHNIRALEEEMVDLLPVEDPDAEAKPENVLRLAMLGRPNAGKSSLVNAMIGEDRMIVSDVAGTTRDSVDIPFVSDGRACEFVDTAGVRRRTRITDTVERFSVNSSLKTTTKADVTLYVIDALEGVTAQDKRLIDLLDERKTPFMILVNKIDLVGRKEQAALEKNFKEVLQFCPHVPVLMVSAMKQVGLGRIVPLAAQIREECNTRIGTGALNRAMEEVLTKHQPPVVKRSRPKFFYLTQAEVAPPTFVFFVSDADRVSETYARYLDRSLRKIFRIEHAPIRVRLRSSHRKKANSRQEMGPIRAPFSPRFFLVRVVKRSAVWTFPYVDKKSPFRGMGKVLRKFFRGTFVCGWEISLFSFSEPLFGERTTSSEGCMGKKTYGFRIARASAKSSLGVAAALRMCVAVSR